MMKVAPVSCVGYSGSGVNVPWDSKTEISCGFFISVFLLAYLMSGAVTLAVRHWAVPGKTERKVGESCLLYALCTFLSLAASIG